MKRTALLALVLLAGCTTTQSYWVKSGSSQQDFYMDEGACKAQAAGVPGMVMIQVAIVYSNCMAGKGWYREERQVPTALGRAVNGG